MKVDSLHWLVFHISFKISEAPSGLELNNIFLKVGQVQAPCKTLVIMFLSQGITHRAAGNHL